MKKQSLAGAWQFRQTGTKEWFPASVPGGVHTDLLALHKIPDPFVGDNEKQVQWVAETDWEYHKVFSIDKSFAAEEHQYLVCDGLDTLAEISLNGNLLGKTDNLFRQWKWDIRSLLKDGENELLMLFRAPVSYITGKQAANPLPGGGDIPGGPHLRKSPYQWGWDWGPKLPPIGIWKDLRLEGYSSARLEDVHIRQHHSDSNISLSASVKLEHWAEDGLEVTLAITSPEGIKQAVSAVPVKNVDGSLVCSLQAAIASPQLWWPNGMGSQPLYQVEVSLTKGTTLLDSRSFQVGLRIIELRREPDQWGECFTFVVNGVPVFAKGADWIPADSFITRVSDAHLEKLIHDAAAAHMNMLRVWGGGIYEEERFYDLCDRYGLMIWQDFIFACGVYPEDNAFAENVRVEAVENVRRLRHRASLALWCGNNEMEQGWVEWKWENPNDARVQRLKAGYERIFHRLLPNIIENEDPDRPYWPSSPSNGVAFANPNGQMRGDAHYWEVWHGRKPFSAYRQQYPRFMSEFGFQALPPYKTIQTYAESKDQNMTSYVMEHHQRSGSGNGLIISQMTDTFRMPCNFHSLVYLSMVLQAEGIRYGVEHWRRNCERVSGTLIWQLNDCWPVASWSSIDYFGRWKALHYAARKFYAPVLLSIEDKSPLMDIHITNDNNSPWNGEVRWSLQTLAGQVLEKGADSAEISARSAKKINSLDLSGIIKGQDTRKLVFLAELWKDGERLARQTALFVPNKHLVLEDPKLEVKVSTIHDDGEQLQFELKAASLARFVELDLEGADEIFSDNYFDIPAGETVKITCPLPEGWNPAKARDKLLVKSLWDSYQ